MGGGVYLAAYCYAVNFNTVFGLVERKFQSLTICKMRVL